MMIWLGLQFYEMYYEINNDLIFETSCFMLKLGCGVASLYQVCGVPFHFALHHCFRLTKNTGNTVSTSNLGGNGQCRFFR